MTASASNELNLLDLARLRPRIDAALAQYAQFDDGCPPALAEAIRYALLAPGKRLRPQLVLMAAEACGGTMEAAMPAACAVEMVHAYSLVHDDLPAMDDDDLRRGRPTCHKVFGEAVAILVGDALQARAFELLATEIQPPTLAARCCAVLGRAAGASALVGGQAADIAMTARLPLPPGEGRGEGELPIRKTTSPYPLPKGEGFETTSNDISRLEAIHARKTGALFVAALELGAVTANASDEQLQAVTAYGRKLGLAFQITDDLLDVAGSLASVGKRVEKDAGHGKLTFPGLLGIEESRRRAKTLVDDACGMIEVFGPKAGQLRALAQFVAEREK
ncbi:MAG TPA: polyprenyl synthetase family protein [Lacipirellulaceae bacterium]|nr:polyprenyl synthetase family protein [Lacipirellulaceae bacterium]